MNNNFIKKIMNNPSGIYVFLAFFPLLYLFLLTINILPKNESFFAFCCILIVICLAFLFYYQVIKLKKVPMLAAILDCLIYLGFFLFSLFAALSPQNFNNKKFEASIFLIIFILNFSINLLLGESCHSVNYNFKQNTNTIALILFLSVVLVFFNLSTVVAILILLYSCYKKYLNVCKDKKRNVEQLDYKLEQIEYYSIILTFVSVFNNILSDCFNYCHTQKTNNILFVFLKYLGNYLINNPHLSFSYYLNNSNIDWFSSIFATMCIFIIVVVVKLLFQGFINNIVKNK